MSIQNQQIMKNTNPLVKEELPLLDLQVAETNNSSYEEPSQLISKDFARLLNNNYTAKNSNSKDPNAIWFSLKELENYIHYIKKQGIEKGYEIDGIRFYIGTYPNDAKYDDKAGLTTLFLSPTGTKTELALISKTTEQSSDIEEISPMNYGSMGNPPKMLYPTN